MGTWHGMINLAGGAPRGTWVQAWARPCGSLMQAQAHTQTNTPWHTQKQ